MALAARNASFAAPVRKRDLQNASSRARLGQSSHSWPRGVYKHDAQVQARSASECVRKLTRLRCVLVCLILPFAFTDAAGRLRRLSVPRIDRDCFVLFPRLSGILNVSAVLHQQAPIPDTANSG